MQEATEAAVAELEGLREDNSLLTTSLKELWKAYQQQATQIDQIQSLLMATHSVQQVGGWLAAWL